MLTARPALSIFSSVYKFIVAAEGKRFDLWRSVRCELETVVCLAPLFWIDLTSNWAPLLVATDASSAGQGLVYDDIAPSAAAEAVGISSSSSLAADGTDDAKLVECQLALPATSVTSLLSSRHWKVAVSRAWRFQAHINELELRALTTGVLWSLSRPSCLGRKLLFLCDSQVAVAAVSKGRSSSHPLLRRLRVIASALLASGSRLVVRWIATHINPADAPSRKSS